MKGCAGWKEAGSEERMCCLRNCKLFRTAEPVSKPARLPRVPVLSRTARLQLQPCHLHCGSQMPVTCLPRAQVSPVLSLPGATLQAPEGPHRSLLPDLLQAPTCSGCLISPPFSSSALGLALWLPPISCGGSIPAAQATLNQSNLVGVAPLSSAQRRRGFVGYGGFQGAWKRPSSQHVGRAWDCESKKRTPEAISSLKWC